MFCTDCGTRNAAESRFCKQCGHEIEKRIEKTSTGRIREEDFDRALPEEEQINALLERAYRARKSGDSALAIALCQEALQLRPDSTTPHSLLGQIYEGLGEREAAIHAYERVLQLNPGSIADRVKLDELRDGDLPVVRGASPPHIVFTQQRLQQGGNQLFVGVALAALLILIGTGIGLALHSHSGPPTNITAGTSVNGTLQSTTPAQNAMNAGVLANPTGPQTSGVADKQTGAAQNTGNITAAYNPFPWSAPPTIVYVPQQTQAGPMIQASVPVNNERSTGATAVHLPGVKSNSNGRGRIVLPSEDQTDEKGIMVIPVGAKDTQKAAPAPTNPSKRQDNPGKIQVTIDPKSGATVDTGQPAGHEARTYITAADDFKINGDYDKAIQALSHALATAGDDTAYVYQQIAHCYQLKGDKTSAVTNYHTAAREYHKMIDSGKQVELAQEGINACDKAIKTCNY